MYNYVSYFRKMQKETIIYVQLLLVRIELLKTRWVEGIAVNSESKRESQKFTVNMIG